MQRFAWVSCPASPCPNVVIFPSKNQEGVQEGIVLNWACLQIGGSWLLLGRTPALAGPGVWAWPCFCPHFLCCCSLFSVISVVPIALLPSPRQGNVIDADAQRHRQMLWGKLSMLGCYLRLHPHLKELAPTCHFQLMVTRALMVSGTEKCRWLWRSLLICSLSCVVLFRSQTQQPSSPSSSPFPISQGLLAL